MMDRFLNSALWFTVMGLIILSGGAALFICYQGLYNVSIRHYPAGLAQVIAGGTLAAGTWLLCRFGNDLMDR